MTEQVLAHPFSDVVTHHGEGPVWIEGRGLMVLDMLAGDVVLLSGDGSEIQRHHVDTIVAALRPRAAGGFVAGIERGFALLNDDLELERTVTCWDDGTVRMNEGATDPDGRFWCGSMAYDMTEGAGALWCLEADGRTRKVITDVSCSNGLAWTSPHGALYIDSLTGAVERLTFDESGELLSRSTFADLSADGVPDGLALDAAGGVWVALFGGGRLIHIDASGVRDGEITLPVSQVTACCFGGDDLSTLFITTSRYGMTEPEERAGAVFVATPAIGGVPVGAFAG